MSDVNLVSFVESEFRVDSRLLASQLDHRHRTIFADILKYQSELEQLSLMQFETEAVKTEGSRGIKHHKCALLTEYQCYFVLTLMRNNDKVVALKLKLVKAFSNARKQLAERDLVRLEGKQIRRSETDAIKDLISYSKDKGSKTEDKWYYVNLTVMTNNAMGVRAGERDSMTARLLLILKMAETMIEVAIRDGMKAELS